MNRIKICAGCALDFLPELSNGRLLTCSDVDHFAGYSSLVGRSQAGCNHVPHIYEIARLPAIAMNDWFLFIYSPVQEYRDNARIGRRRILSWAVNIEIAQVDCFEIIQLAVNGPVLFSCQFLNRIGA